MSVKQGVGAGAGFGDGVGVGVGVGFGVGVGVSFLHIFCHFFFLLTQILISRNLHQLCIFAIFSDVTKINKIKRGGAHFFASPQTVKYRGFNNFSYKRPLKI